MDVRETPSRAADVPASISHLAEPCSPIGLPDGGVYDRAARTYTRGDVSVKLTRKTGLLLGALAARQEYVCTYATLKQVARIKATCASALPMLVRTLRTKLKFAAPDLVIKNCRGLGYVLRLRRAPE